VGAASELCCHCCVAQHCLSVRLLATSTMWTSA
jgi:hypothetical protein